MTPAWAEAGRAVPGAARALEKSETTALAALHSLRFVVLHGMAVAVARSEPPGTALPASAQAGTPAHGGTLGRLPPGRLLRAAPVAVEVCGAARRISGCAGLLARIRPKRPDGNHPDIVVPDVAVAVRHDHGHSGRLALRVPRYAGVAIGLRSADAGRTPRLRGRSGPAGRRRRSPGCSRCGPPRPAGRRSPGDPRGWRAPGRGGRVRW